MFLRYIFVVICLILQFQGSIAFFVHIFNINDMQNQDVKQVAANNSNRYHVLAEMVADKIKEKISNDNYEGEACVDADDFLVEFSYGTEFKHCTGATSTRMFHPDIVEEYSEPIRYYAEIIEVWDAEGDPNKDAVTYIDGVINSLIN